MPDTPERPNILVLMTDQMQGRTLDPGHPCRTPNLDRLAAQGVRVERAYTTNPVCSPARASLMTGLQPHAHGVVSVTHNADADQFCLRENCPHWAQRLEAAGYHTGYFGKWHVERSDRLERFGWQVNGVTGGQRWKQAAEQLGVRSGHGDLSERVMLAQPADYEPALLAGVTDVPAARRGMGVATELGLRFLDDAIGGAAPWCCFVSITEPHDPFICGRDAYGQYDLDRIALPESASDPLSDRPGLYRKSRRAFESLSDEDRRRMTACYWGMISELDGQFGRLVDRLEQAGVLDNTIVLLTSDHGECLGAHGLYMKNVGAFEEIYHIPMLVRGPGVARGETAAARVGLHDVGPTLLELAGVQGLGHEQARSFAALLSDPAGMAGAFTTGFAEYFGTRYWLTQRVVWDGPWKLVWNGFDFDELYHLERDPHELANLADDPAHADQLRHMMAQAWRYVRDTDDHTLWNSQYPPLRLAPYGPGAVDER